MISRSAEYALRAIVVLAQQRGESLLTPQVAEITKVPTAYLSKVLRTLGRGGLVQSRRGVGGGFTLARPADQISLLEVVNAVDPPQRIHHCPLDLESHSINLCPLHRRLDEAMALIEHSFAETTVAQILSEPGWETPLCEKGGSNRT
jgi:Rrf2 family protein